MCSTDPDVVDGRIVKQGLRLTIAYGVAQFLDDNIKEMDGYFGSQYWTGGDKSGTR